MSNFGNYPTGGYNGYYGGMMFQGQPSKITMTQGLSKEELDSLKKNTSFTLEISEEELKRSFCTHRTADRFTVATDDEGRLVCAQCGTVFTPFDGDVQEAAAVVEKMVDLMETTKMKSVTLPTKTIRDLYQIEPLLKKIPKLYERASIDCKNDLGLNNCFVPGYENNAFAAYQNMLNPMAGNGFYDPAMGMNNNVPVYGAQMIPQQPMYNQPMMNNGMMPQQENPFMNNAPVAQQTAPAQDNQEQVTVTKTLTD